MARRELARRAEAEEEARLVRHETALVTEEASPNPNPNPNPDPNPSPNPNP